MSGKGAKGLAGKGAKGLHGVDKSKAGDKKKPTSRSARAGLQFPVGRVHRLLKVCLLRGQQGARGAPWRQRQGREKGGTHSMMIPFCLLPRP